MPQADKCETSTRNCGLLGRRPYLRQTPFWFSAPKPATARASAGGLPPARPGCAPGSETTTCCPHQRIQTEVQPCLIVTKVDAKRYGASELPTRDQPNKNR